MTDFKDILIKYMEELDCSSKELADSSGLSAATISRYRSGERIPDVESDNLKQLIYGIVKLAQKRNLSSINDITVHSDFLRFLPDISADFSILQANLNTLFTMLSINTSEFARFLNYDASYISRIKSGERQPADPELFLVNTALFVTKRYTKKTDLSIISEFIGLFFGRFTRGTNVFISFKTLAPDKAYGHRQRTAIFIPFSAKIG